MEQFAQGLETDSDGKIRPPPTPQITPEMKEFLEKNPLPKFDTDEFDKRWQEKKEERKKYSGHTTAYQEMEAASTPPKETPDGKDPTEELEERLRTGNFEFPELPEYNEEFEQIKHYAEKVIQSNSSSNSQMKDSPTNDTAEREHVEKMLDELMSREPPKNPYKNKPEENEGNKQEPWRQTPKQPLEEKRQMNPYEGSMDPEYNLLSDEKVLEILQSDGFQEFVKQQTGQSREEIKDELTTIGERVKIARTLQGKGGFSEYLHESYDPSKPEKFDYVTEKFEEHMDGSLGDIGNALPEERDKLFGKDTEKGKWLHKRAPDITLGEVPLLLLDYNRLAAENLALQEEIKELHKELQQLQQGRAE